MPSGTSLVNHRGKTGKNSSWFSLPENGGYKRRYVCEFGIFI